MNNVEHGWIGSKEVISNL